MRKLLRRKVGPLECSGRQVMSYEQGLLLRAYTKKLKTLLRQRHPRTKIAVVSHPLYSVVTATLYNTDTVLPDATLYQIIMDAYRGAPVLSVSEYGYTNYADWISDYDDVDYCQSVSEEPVMIVVCTYPQIKGWFGTQLTKTFNVSDYWHAKYNY